MERLPLFSGSSLSLGFLNTLPTNTGTERQLSAAASFAQDARLPGPNVCFRWTPSWRETHLLTSAFCLLDPSRAVSWYWQEWHLGPDNSLLGGGWPVPCRVFSSPPGFCLLNPTVPPTPRCDSQRQLVRTMWKAVNKIPTSIPGSYKEPSENINRCYN